MTKHFRILHYNRTWYVLGRIHLLGLLSQRIAKNNVSKIICIMLHKLHTIFKLCNRLLSLLPCLVFVMAEKKLVLIKGGESLLSMFLSVSDECRSARNRKSLSRQQCSEGGGWAEDQEKSRNDRGRNSPTDQSIDPKGKGRKRNAVAAAPPQPHSDRRGTDCTWVHHRACTIPGESTPAYFLYSIIPCSVFVARREFKMEVMEVS